MLYYANEESDDVINSFTNNTESRISPERLEQCSYNLAQEMYIVKKRQNETYHVVAMATLLAPVSFYEKPNIPICNLFEDVRAQTFSHTDFVKTLTGGRE